MTATQVVLVSRDLLFGSRIADAAARAGVNLVRVDEPAQLPPATSVSLVLVDWGERQPSWGDQLKAWTVDPLEAARVILYGPHTDLEAHADARAFGLGPMWARSKLAADVQGLLAGLSRRTMPG